MALPTLKAPRKLADEYDFDAKHPGAPAPMFGKGTCGDCVLAGRAHRTLRFERIELEQKKIKAFLSRLM